MIHVSFCFVFCFLWLFMFLVCSEQLNWSLFFRKILHVLQILQFYSIFWVFEPFPAVTEWFLDPSFHPEDNWETQTQLLKRFKHSLMLQKETRCIKSRGVKTFWIWRSRYILINLSSGKHPSIFCCFLRVDKIGKNKIFLQNKKNVIITEKEHRRGSFR